MKSLAFITCLLLLQVSTLHSQQLCLEQRTDDDAIIKELVEKNGIFYLTVDVVQVIEHEDGGSSVKNENPKLRTFVIDPYTEWDLCVPVQATIKVRDLINKRDWFIDTFMNYSAKEGRVVKSMHYGCEG